MRSKENLAGAWAVLAGVIIAIILGIFQASFFVSRRDWIYALLAILGFIVGMVSVSNDSREATTFLLAIMSLVVVSYMGQTALALVGNVGINIVTVLNALLTMFIPATIVVALKTVFSVTSIR